MTTATASTALDAAGVRTELASAIVAGAALAAVLTLSPLTVVVAALAAATIVASRNGLVDPERRWLTTLLVVALAARVVAVLALFLVSIPSHSAQHAGVLFGDEVYSLGRSLRTRNALVGIPIDKLDYQTIFDSYARTRYMSWLSWLQVAFGPSAYAIRLLNGVLFIGGAALLYRLARRGFGVVPAIGALAALLFLPSLFFWSISLLKESMYFLWTACAIAGAAFLVRPGSWRQRAGGLLLLLVSLSLLADLRPSAVALTAGGLLLGLTARWVMQT